MHPNSQGVTSTTGKTAKDLFEKLLHKIIVCLNKVKENSIFWHWAVPSN